MANKANSADAKDYATDLQVSQKGIAMLKHLENESRYTTYLEYITEDNVKRAYLYIIGSSACLRDYVCYPSEHGFIERDFRFDYNKKWYFSCVINKKSLLFYFRLPCQSNPKYNRESIINNFPVDKDKYTLRIYDIDMAIRVMCYIAG
ncbi:hypothetical protein KAR91_36540 [Candidatus Pacearchaeota archaeon]|nr:hypothetical protein [Candidatus Pacearchaeota archaeon]